MLKKIYEEKTNSWFFVLSLRSFNDDGDNDVSDHSEESMQFKNVLVVCTPWTYRMYELKKNIIGVAMNYTYKGRKWFSSKEYGISITREKHIHFSWGVHEKDQVDTGFYRLWTPWFTERYRTTHHLLYPDGSVYDSNPKCCDDSWNAHPFKMFDAIDDGEKFKIKAKLEYSRYSFFKNKPMCFITKLFKVDKEIYDVDLKFLGTKNGIGKRKLNEWKGGTIGVSIEKEEKHESIDSVVKRFCISKNIILGGHADAD